MHWDAVQVGAIPGGAAIGREHNAGEVGADPNRQINGRGVDGEPEQRNPPAESTPSNEGRRGSAGRDVVVGLLGETSTRKHQRGTGLAGSEDWGFTATLDGNGASEPSRASFNRRVSSPAERARPVTASQRAVLRSCRTLPGHG